MDMEMTLLSDDALDAVSGGMINIISEGQPPIAGSTKSKGQGSASSGNSSFVQGLEGVLGVVQGTAWVGIGVIAATGLGSTII
jgi:hypothetical protein